MGERGGGGGGARELAQGLGERGVGLGRGSWGVSAANCDDLSADRFVCKAN